VARLLSVSVSDDLLRQAEALARSQGKTKSEVVREALRRHVQLERLHALQRYGRQQAEQRGIGPEDAETLVDALRGDRA
jgi:CopG family transcriptional regulator/antitoxin EndoAI